MNILVTGGAGYIGSHTVVQLLEAGHRVTVLDNLCNSNVEVFNRIERITELRPVFVEGDIRNGADVAATLKSYEIEAVIHFAGLKAVGESVEMPIEYYQNNVQGSLTLFDEMRKAGCKRLVFSSSATVYGDPARVPITEDMALSATNPYGQSKLMIEEMLRDIAKADPEWEIALLRYFNPVGAHPSGLIGEDPSGIPNNLMPYVAQVAAGRLQQLKVFGDDYNTADGTGVRDYIHVVDLSAGHLRALDTLKPGHGCQAYNIGTGAGYSVLDVVKMFREISGQAINYEVVPRRKGDVAVCYADPAFSEAHLGWKAQYGLEDMIRDHWNWQRKNPQGYREAACPSD
ncbi:MAG: UDP-glucose 4-epimerase GalE [Pontibacterium sp.]